MTKAQIFKRKTGIILAIIGIILSLLPAVRMADGTKLFIFQIIGNERFFNMERVAEYPEEIITGVLFSILFIYGLLVHIINLILWLRKTEKTYIGIMALSIGSCLGLVMSMCVISFGAGGNLVSVLPFTIWQCLRIPVTLGEAVVKLHGEEIYNVFLSNNTK